MKVALGLFIFYGWALVAAFAAYVITKGRSRKARIVAVALSFLIPALLTTAFIARIFYVGDR